MINTPNRFSGLATSHNHGLLWPGGVIVTVLLLVVVWDRRLGPWLAAWPLARIVHSHEQDLDFVVLIRGSVLVGTAIDSMSMMVMYTLILI